MKWYEHPLYRAYGDRKEGRKYRVITDGQTFVVEELARFLWWKWWQAVRGGIEGEFLYSFPSLEMAQDWIDNPRPAFRVV